jgi:hypothetical protein
VSIENRGVELWFAFAAEGAVVFAKRARLGLESMVPKRTAASI